MANEYHLDTSLAHESWAKLDAFTQGYIEAAMWTLTDSWFECDECEHQPEEWNNGDCAECGAVGTVHEHSEPCGHLGLHDIAAETITKAQEDCAAFVAEFRVHLDMATTEQPHCDDASHGHDFWLTRNGHGAGFWDRGYSAGLSKVLTKGAKQHGECYWYVGDDGNVYQG